MSATAMASSDPAEDTVRTRFQPTHGPSNTRRTAAGSAIEKAGPAASSWK